MKDVCCLDCEYYIVDTVFDGNDDLQIREYCQRGSVLIEIEDAENPRDCADFKQFVEDI